MPPQRLELHGCLGDIWVLRFQAIRATPLSDTSIALPSHYILTHFSFRDLGTVTKIVGILYGATRIKVEGHSRVAYKRQPK